MITVFWLWFFVTLFVFLARMIIGEEESSEEYMWDSIIIALFWPIGLMFKLWKAFWRVIRNLNLE